MRRRFTRLGLGLLLALHAATAAAAPAELPEDPRRNDLFGAAIAEDGEWLAIGAPGDNDRAFNGGAVYLFELGGAAPRLRHKLHADDPRPQAWFGAALAIDGERLIVGGADELTRSFDTPPGHGAAWIFRRDGDAWEEEAHLQLDEAGVLADTYGAGVALVGERAAVVTASAQIGYAWSSGFVDVYEAAEGWQRVAHHPLPTESRAGSLVLVGDRVIVGLDGGDAPLLVLARGDGGWAAEAPPPLSIGDALAVAGDAASTAVAVVGVHGLAVLRAEEGAVVVEKEIALTSGPPTTHLDNLSLSPGSITIARVAEGDAPRLTITTFLDEGGAWAPGPAAELGHRGVHTVALAGGDDHLLVGQPFREVGLGDESDTRGRVELLRRDGSAWIHERLLEPSDGPGGCRIGDDGARGAPLLSLVLLAAGRRRRRSHA